MPDAAFVSAMLFEDIEGCDVGVAKVKGRRSMIEDRDSKGPRG